MPSRHAFVSLCRLKMPMPTAIKTSSNRANIIPFSLFLLVVSTLLLLNTEVRSISIDNDIIGEPDIECLDQEIRVWIKTRKYFQGRIYAKGKADDPECAKDDFSSRRTKKVHFDLGLGRCGMKNLRSVDPRGMYYGITLVVSFHPMFITKVDQAFHVKCFFEEANRGLTAELGVSMIPTTEVEARHGIPGCTYSIHKSSIDELDSGKPAGSAIQFAKVGDKVLHQWHCDDQMFGILINNCFVTDGVKQKVQVIDNRGCPLDPILITGIRYSADLQRAYAESQVFKFADRPGVWFFCQIQMCMKKDTMCDGVTPPSCATTITTSSTSKTTSIANKGGNRRILPGTGRRKGADSGEERPAGSDYSEVAGGHEPGQVPPNSSDERDRGTSSRTGGAAPEYDERPSSSSSTAEPGGSGRPLASGDYEPGEGASTGGDYETAGAPTIRPEYTSTAKPPGRKQGKQRGNQSGAYGPPSTPIGYDHQQQQSGEEPGQQAEETATVFGPGFAANQVGGDVGGPYGVGRDPPGMLALDGFPSPLAGGYLPPAGGLSPAASNPYVPPAPPPASSSRRQELVSTEFEAEDDLRRRPSPSSSTANTPLVRPTATVTPGPADLLSSTERAANGPKKDYVDDYEADVTIPPHLTDLLANLQPEDINAENLQKMFRDSVGDRRALLHGFDLLIRKMKLEEEAKQEQRGKGRKRRKETGTAERRKLERLEEAEERVEEEEEEPPPGRKLHKARLPGQKVDRLSVGLETKLETSGGGGGGRLARDSPIGPAAVTAPNMPLESKVESTIFGQPPSAQWHAFRQSDSPADPPVIAGQLLIYDLDETPPPSLAPTEHREAILLEECALTRHGLTLLGFGSASLALMLFLLALLVFLRLRNEKREAERKAGESYGGSPKSTLLEGCSGRGSTSLANLMPTDFGKNEVEVKEMAPGRTTGRRRAGKQPDSYEGGDQMWQNQQPWSVGRNHH